MLDILLIFVLCILGTIGDICLKQATLHPLLQNRWLIAGSLAYALSVFGWFQAFKHLKLITIAGLYSSIILFLLVFIGIVFYGEHVTLREGIGLGLALLAILLLRVG